MTTEKATVQFACRGLTPDGRPALREESAADVSAVLSIEGDKIDSEVRCLYFVDGLCTASQITGHLLDRERVLCPNAFTGAPPGWEPPEILSEMFNYLRRSHTR